MGKGLIFMLIAISVLIIRNKYGDFPASVYGIIAMWIMGRNS